MYVVIVHRPEADNPIEDVCGPYDTAIKAYEASLKAAKVLFDEYFDEEEGNFIDSAEIAGFIRPLSFDCNVAINKSEFECEVWWEVRELTQEKE